MFDPGGFVVRGIFFCFILYTLSIFIIIMMSWLLKCSSNLNYKCPKDEDDFLGPNIILPFTYYFPSPIWQQSQFQGVYLRGGK